MDPETFRDPRHADPEASPAEVEAWAERERRRRAEWLEGPGEQEKQDWAIRYRRRAALGLEESRLGPSPEEIGAWAERERRRRKEWAEGPGDEEKRRWASGQRLRSFAGLSESPLPAGAGEIEAWARREADRRKAWLAGPAEEEKREYARRTAAASWSEGASYADLASRFFREAELAGKGSLWAIASAPAAIWSYFVRAGRRLERDMSEPPRRGRVPF